MDYESLYHEINRRRKIEIDLCHKSITTASKLYDNVIAVCNKYQNEDSQIAEMRMLCSDTCAALESTYQALLETDVIIEKMRIDEDVQQLPIIYLDLFKKEQH